MQRSVSLKRLGFLRTIADRAILSEFKPRTNQITFLGGMRHNRNIGLNHKNQQTLLMVSLIGPDESQLDRNI